MILNTSRFVYEMAWVCLISSLQHSRSPWLVHDVHNAHVCQCSLYISARYNFYDFAYVCVFGFYVLSTIKHHCNNEPLQRNFIYYLECNIVLRDT